MTKEKKRYKKKKLVNNSQKSTDIEHIRLTVQSICLENKGFNSEIKQEVQNWEHGT